MPHMVEKKARAPKGELPSEELVIRVRKQLVALGPNNVAAALRLDLKTVLGVGAGCYSLPGTLALIRERLPALEQGEKA
jgi:hypothetical protein